MAEKLTETEKKARALARTKAWRAENPDKVKAYNDVLRDRRNAAKAAA